MIGPVIVVVIEHHTCPCRRRERPDPAETLIAARRLAGARPLPRRQVQPEPVSRPVVVRLGPGELGEDLVEFGGWDAAAGVGHGEDRRSAGSAMPVSAQQWL
jgi:hypothetical protein